MNRKCDLVDVSTHSRPKAAGMELMTRMRGFDVSTHSRPKAAGVEIQTVTVKLRFQHTAARRRLVGGGDVGGQAADVSTHSRPKAAGMPSRPSQPMREVSTHSRPKAAGNERVLLWIMRFCFNTQPPEGGWFQACINRFFEVIVSTHSRPKAAGITRVDLAHDFLVSTHSRPKAAGASLKSLAPSSFAAPISLSSQEKRECEYNIAFSVTPAFTIS